MNVTELQVVGRQVLASLPFCSAIAREPKIKPNRWASRVNANGTELDLPRVFRNRAAMTVPEIEALAMNAPNDRSWNVLARALSSPAYR